jgi:hypothetical protein
MYQDSTPSVSDTDLISRLYKELSVQSNNKKTNNSTKSWPKDLNNQVFREDTGKPAERCPVSFIRDTYINAP